MRPEVLKYLSDALDCAIAIQEAVKGKEFSDFQDERILRSAVYHEFSIIGEALTQMRRLDETVFEKISESRKIVGFRNQIIHGYQKIDDTVTWQIIQDKLPILRKELEQLLAK